MGTTCKHSKRLLSQIDMQASLMREYGIGILVALIDPSSRSGNFTIFLKLPRLVVHKLLR